MTQVVERQLVICANLLVYRARYAYTARFGQFLNSCRQIDAITINIVPVVYDFAKVDTNPELQALAFGQLCVPGEHLTLKIDSGVNRCGDTLKLRQNGIPRLMDFPATMRCNDFGEQVEASIKFSVSFLLIKPRKSTITGDICV